MVGCVDVAYISYSGLINSHDLGGQETAESKNDGLEGRHYD